MFSLFKKDDGISIHVSEIDSILENGNLIDIREAYECSNGAIEKSKNISMGQLLSNPDKYLKNNKKYYIICQSGARSARTTSVLRKAGYDVVNVRGGMNGYRGTNRK